MLRERLWPSVPKGIPRFCPHRLSPQFETSQRGTNFQTNIDTQMTKIIYFASSVVTILFAPGSHCISEQPQSERKPMLSAPADAWAGEPVFAQLVLPQFPRAGKAPSLRAEFRIAGGATIVAIVDHLKAWDFRDDLETEFWYMVLPVMEAGPVSAELVIAVDDASDDKPSQPVSSSMVVVKPIPDKHAGAWAMLLRSNIWTHAAQAIQGTTTSLTAQERGFILGLIGSHSATPYALYAHLLLGYIDYKCLFDAFNNDGPIGCFRDCENDLKQVTRQKERVDPAVEHAKLTLARAKIFSREFEEADRFLQEVLTGPMSRRMRQEVNKMLKELASYRLTPPSTRPWN